MLQRIERDGVVLLAEKRGCVCFAFSERSGGVSKPPYESLNLGAHVGDDPAAVVENRRRVLAALGQERYIHNLVVPTQVHGDRVLVLDSADQAFLECARRNAAQGADAIVCTAAHVPVMLCFADCVPVVLICDKGFALIHSGWKGTIARISARAASSLMSLTSTPVHAISAYMGPHILGSEYEVSPELIKRFGGEFSSVRACGTHAPRTLDLAGCITETLRDIGVLPSQIKDSKLSTLSLPDRFYSYRREGEVCGRHGALACIDASQGLS